MAAAVIIAVTVFLKRNEALLIAEAERAMAGADGNATSARAAAARRR